MWQRLSFSSQLLLPLGAMFVAALLMGGALLHVFTTGQLASENEPAQRSTRAVADALNNALRSSDNPQQTLDEFVRALDASSDIQFHPAAAGSPPLTPRPLQGSHGPPQWFVSLLSIPDLHIAFPVAIDGRRVGEIVFAPDLSAALFETWVGFLALAGFVIALAGLTALVARVVAGSALRPLQNLGDGLTRMRRGDYAQPIPVEGPPEIRQSCAEANALAAACIVFETPRSLTSHTVKYSVATFIEKIVFEKSYNAQLMRSIIGARTTGRTSPSINMSGMAC